MGARNLTKKEENAKFYKIFFDFVVSKKSPEKIAEEMGMSYKEVMEIIGHSRNRIAEDIKRFSKTYIADVYAMYSSVYEKAHEAWENTGDPKYLDLMRRTAKDMGILFGVNAPPKTAVSHDSMTDEIPQIVFNLDDDEYKKKEEEYKKSEVINAEYTEEEDDE